MEENKKEKSLKRKKLKKKKVSGFSTQLPYIIILLISTAGFAAGIMENSITEEADTWFSIVVELQEEADLLTSEAEYVLDNDFDGIRVAEEVRRDIFINLAEWFDLLWVNISDLDTLKIINTTHRLSVRNLLWEMAQILNDTTAYRIYRHFEIEHNLFPFIIVSKEPDGVDYNISKEMWDFNEVESFIFVPMLEFLNESLIVDGFPPNTDILQNLLETTPKVLFFPNMRKLHELYNAPLFGINGRIFEAENMVNELSNRANQVSLGVSVTTVGAVLSTSMSNRVEKEGIITRITSIINKDEEGKKAKADKLSLTILYFAAGVSMFALFFVWLSI